MMARIDRAAGAAGNSGADRADQRPRAIFLMGPTASGKTALALSLADRFPLHLVSVDSALVYRGLDIGAAKPAQATLARYPHRLIDIREPSQRYSAAAFAADAMVAMREISSAGAVPLLVGGTGLYFRALEHGLSALPEGDERLRAKFSAQAQQLGWPALHARLAALDPVAAARIRPADPQRIQRALEVIELTGRPLSAQQSGPVRRLPWRILKLALMPSDRGLLHARIRQRFEAMLAAGFVDEVRKLRSVSGWHTDLPAMRAVGYRQAWPFLDGSIDIETLSERAIAATRQLAKRQITWLRSELDARVLDPDAATLADDVAAAVQLFLGQCRDRA